MSRGPRGDLDLRVVSETKQQVQQLPSGMWCARVKMKVVSPVPLIQMLRVEVEHRQAGRAEFVQILHGAGVRGRPRCREVWRVSQCALENWTGYSAAA